MVVTRRDNLAWLVLAVAEFARIPTHAHRNSCEFTDAPKLDTDYGQCFTGLRRVIREACSSHPNRFILASNASDEWMVASSLSCMHDFYRSFPGCDHLATGEGNPLVSVLSQEPGARSPIFRLVLPPGGIDLRRNCGRKAVGQAVHRWPQFREWNRAEDDLFYTQVASKTTVAVDRVNRPDPALVDAVGLIPLSADGFDRAVDERVVFERPAQLGAGVAHVPDAVVESAEDQ
jgi:hypothetical protein